MYLFSICKANVGDSIELEELLRSYFVGKYPVGSHGIPMETNLGNKSLAGSTI